MRKLTLSLAAIGLAISATPAALAYTSSDLIGEYSCISRSTALDMETTMDLTLNMNGKARADGVMKIIDPSYEMTFDFTYDYSYAVSGDEILETDIDVVVENGMFNGEPLPASLQADFQDEMSGMEDTSSTLIHAADGVLIYRGSDDVTTCIAYQG